MSEGKTPDRYTPDNLGRYKVRDAGAGSRNWLSARIGNPCLEVLGAEEGDYIVVEEDGDALRVTLDEVQEAEDSFRSTSSSTESEQTFRGGAGDGAEETFRDGDRERRDLDGGSRR